MTTPTPTWTHPQRTALEHTGGDLLVSAAAGSGKTAVLAERCARLVCDPSQTTSIENLLVLTFTEAAATEMRSRIAAAIHQRLQSPESPDHARWLRRQSAMVERAAISTLHAFCARVLRQNFHEAHIDPAFDLLDEDEARLIREETIEDLLARHHNAKAGGGGREPFADFFESYAQGRDSNCRDMILRVYHMLASSADPQTYLTNSRNRFLEPKLPQTVADFVTHALLPELKLLGLTTHRAITRTESLNVPGTLASSLKEIAKKIEWSMNALATRGAAAIEDIRLHLDHDWPTIRAPKEFDKDQFDLLKDQTWERIKAGTRKFVSDSLAFSHEQLLENLRHLSAPLETLLTLVEDFTTDYTAGKRTQNRLDFADLERLTLTLLTDNKNLAAKSLRDRYHHLLVDEFQDINPLQAALLEAVRSPDRFNHTGNLFVVGDVKQSIYAFRLAEPALFLKREENARDPATSTRFIALPHNFRSQPKLLAAMNGIFEKILTHEVAGVHYNDGHALEPSPSAQQNPTTPANLLTGTPIELHLVVMDAQEADDDEEEKSDDTAEPEKETLSAIEQEARMVATRITTLMAENHVIQHKNGELRPLKLRDIAILLRAVRSKAMIFARALAREGIHVHADLSTGYFDAPEVRDTLALLQILDNPQQDIPLATALLGPFGRFSHNDLATIRLAYDKKTIPFQQAVPNYMTDHATEPLAKNLKSFFEKIATWRAHLRTRPLHEALADIFADSHIFAYLAGFEAGDQRIANLQSLHQRALKFSNFRKQGLHRFLRFIEKLHDQETDFGEAPVLSEASDVVRIMSIHKSKGLEFPVVFVSGLGSPMNLADPGPVYIHRDFGIALANCDLPRNIYFPSPLSAQIQSSLTRSNRAEELRLLYVALTRSRDHLILTGTLAKEKTLPNLREEWHSHTGPLPEDALLRARSHLDYLLSALASSSTLHIQWPEEKIPSPQLEVTIHPPCAMLSGAGAPLSMPLEPSSQSTAEKILAGVPLSPIPQDPSISQLITRVTSTYPHEIQTHQPALQTVSQLKNQITLPATEDEIPPQQLIQTYPKDAGSLSRMEAAKQRGIATHRILQLLDFRTANSKAEIESQLKQLEASAKLTPEEIASADLDGILWFLLDSSPGKQIRTALQNPTVQLLRELPFIWTAPLNIPQSPPSPTARGNVTSPTETLFPAIQESESPSTDPADNPTIRGTIDLLLLNPSEKSAHLFDYKTDSPSTWQSNLEPYRRQMHYYKSATTQILNYPTVTTTLIFLSPKEYETQ